MSAGHAPPPLGLWMAPRRRLRITARNVRITEHNVRITERNVHITFGSSENTNSDIRTLILSLVVDITILDVITVDNLVDVELGESMYMPPETDPP